MSCGAGMPCGAEAAGAGSDMTKALNDVDGLTQG